MRDITADMTRYREAARHLWNTAFQRGADFDVRDDFSRVATELFNALVLNPLEATEQRLPEMGDAEPTPFRRISIEPSADRVPILVNRGTQSYGYWDDPVNVVARGEATLRFVSFFDWDQLAPRDFHYVLAHISGWPAHPHLVDRFALLEFSLVRFALLDEPSA